MSWNLYAEVIDDRGILIWEAHISSGATILFRKWEFSINDGWAHSNIVEEPSGSVWILQNGNSRNIQSGNILKNLQTIVKLFHIS